MPLTHPKPNHWPIRIVIDYLFVSITVLLLLPFVLPIIILIKLDSHGPILYRRRVLGLDGVPFDAFKFRTMVVNGDTLLKVRPDLQQELATNHKLIVDPRVTRIGRFLRRTSLDELPQLINVLRGEMSLIGPRMITSAELPMYGIQADTLFTVRPGITGLWQVSGRSNLDYATRVELDMHYIQNWSIWLDMMILWRTPFVVLKGEGAY